MEAQPLLLSIVVHLHQEPLLLKEDIDSKPFTAKSPVPCLELRQCCTGSHATRTFRISSKYFAVSDKWPSPG